MDLNQLKNRYVNGIYKTKSLLIKEEPFTLKSGGKSHIYLNHRNFLVKSEYLAVVAEMYSHSIQEHVNNYQLGVVDSVMSPIIVGAISAAHENDLIIIRSKKLEHGVKLDIFGECRGEVVIVDDMTSTGSTPLRLLRNVLRRCPNALVTTCAKHSGCAMGIGGSTYGTNRTKDDSTRGTGRKALRPISNRAVTSK